MTEEKQTYTSKDKQELHKAGDTPLTTKDLLFKIMEKVKMIVYKKKMGKFLLIKMKKV